MNEQHNCICDKHPIYAMHPEQLSTCGHTAKPAGTQKAWKCSRSGCTRHFTNEDGYLDITPDGQRTTWPDAVRCEVHEGDYVYMIVDKGSDGVYRYTCTRNGCQATKPYTVPPQYQA